MRNLTLLAIAAPMPAMAAGDAFFSLKNTDFVVLLGFLLFIAILFYFKVPSMVAGLLDKRADTIKSELEEAKALRDEAQAVLATYERKQQEMTEQADRIVATAKKYAEAAAAQAKVDLAASIERRIQTAEEQIAAAEASAVKEIRDRAISVAIAAAAEAVAKQTSDAEQDSLIDDAIAQVEARLH